MKNNRRKFSTAFKIKVVLEALSERYSIQELGRKHQIHPNQINKWKSHFLENAETVFDSGNGSAVKPESAEEKLYKKIGELQMEVDFLKKALS